jgi:hypothetical protein
MSNPLDSVEGVNAMRGLAELARGFYLALQEQGFDPLQSMRLTDTWLRSTIAASAGQDNHGE